MTAEERLDDLPSISPPLSIYCTLTDTASHLPTQPHPQTRRPSVRPPIRPSDPLPSLPPVSAAVSASAEREAAHRLPSYVSADSMRAGSILASCLVETRCMKASLDFPRLLDLSAIVSQSGLEFAFAEGTLVSLARFFWCTRRRSCP